MAILGKHVTAIRSDGRKTRALIMVEIFRAAKTSPLLKSEEELVFMETTGELGSVAAEAREENKIINRIKAIGKSANLFLYFSIAELNIGN